MKSFDKVIKIEVEANHIANLLLGNMNPEFAHAVSTVEAIIGSSSDHSLAMMYNALNGFSPEIDFQVGDVVKVKDLKVYGYWTQESINNGNSVREQVPSAKIIEIDVYSTEKVKLEYTTPTVNGGNKIETTWVSHLRCSELAELKEAIDLRKGKYLVD